jgi:hypothetical protein
MYEIEYETDDGKSKCIAVSRSECIDAIITITQSGGIVTFVDKIK